MTNREFEFERLFLKNYKSFANEELQLANPLFLVGRNGAGKSNLLDAFQLLADAMTLPLAAAFTARGGINNVRMRTPGRGQPRNMHIGIIGSAVHEGNIRHRYRYGFEVRAEKKYGYSIVREQCVITRQVRENSRIFIRKAFFDRKGHHTKSTLPGLSVAPEPTSLVLPLAGGLEEFAPLALALSTIRTYRISSEVMREFQVPDAGLSMKRDGSNASSVLQEIMSRSPADFERIGELLEAAIPQTTTVRAVSHGNKLSLEFSQAWDNKSLRFEGFNMSDGTLRLLGILLSIFQKEQPSVVGIEEPESSLHPGAVGVLLDVLQAATYRSQVLVTTQSPDVLESEMIGDNNLRIVEWGKGASKVRSLGEVPRSALKTHLMTAGELFRSNQLIPAQGTSPRRLFVDI